MKIFDVNYFVIQLGPLWRPALELNGLPCVNKVLLYLSLLQSLSLFVCTIFFMIAGEATLLNIRAAIKEWQDKLCLVFKERQYEDDYIEFAYEGGYV